MKLYKLISGDEVIGQEAPPLYLVKESTGESELLPNQCLKLLKPRVLVPVLGPKGPQIMLRPFYMGNPQHETVTLKPEHIIDSAPAQKVLEDAYLQETSGLILGGKLTS